MPNPLITSDTNLTKKGVKIMPKVVVQGKVKHFPYTSKGKKAARKAKAVNMKKTKNNTKYLQE